MSNADHRAAVARLMSGRVPVTITNHNKEAPATWQGRVIAIINEPAVLLELDDGNKIMLPLQFNIAEAED
jgi:hypothetical protein